MSWRCYAARKSIIVVFTLTLLLAPTVYLARCATIFILFSFVCQNCANSYGNCMQGYRKFAELPTQRNITVWQGNASEEWRKSGKALLANDDENLARFCRQTMLNIWQRCSFPSLIAFANIGTAEEFLNKYINKSP